MTAHDALFTQCGLAMGDRVCVHGAAGGVGTAAVQLAHAAGAHVTATVRDASRHDDVRALGADVVITPDRVRRQRRTYDVILELVGAPNMETNLRRAGDRRAHQRDRRRWRVAIATLNLLDLMQQARRDSRIDAAGPSAGSEGRRGAAPGTPRGAAVGRWRDYACRSSATYPLDEVEAAYERFAAGGKLGKDRVAGRLARRYRRSRLLRSARAGRVPRSRGNDGGRRACAGR